MAFVYPIYNVPFGIELGEIPVSGFSGEPTSGILVDSSGAVFFSPALLAANNGNEIDLDEISLTAYASDTYNKPRGSLNKRNFTWGPNNSSVTNDSHWVTAPKHYTAVATMIQTIPPGPTTMYRVP